MSWGARAAEWLQAQTNGWRHLHWIAPTAGRGLSPRTAVCHWGSAIIRLSVRSALGRDSGRWTPLFNSVKREEERRRDIPHSQSATRVEIGREEQKKGRRLRVNGGQIEFGDRMFNDKNQYGGGKPAYWRPLDWVAPAIHKSNYFLCVKSILNYFQTGDFLKQNR